ncbi:MAG: SGNH/GDSL hydrolase family protein [Clostridia bacterium]|nr:SGNH/GDSL hydrolase family protein [Clostridia bacterium]
MKKVIRIISFVCALLIVLGAVLYFGAVLQDARLDNREGHLLCGYYDTTDMHDVIFIGDCEVYEGFVPATLFEEYGITSYVRGSSQQTVWQSYHILEETLERETPKAVVFNVLALKYGETPLEEISRMSLEDMEWSGSKLEAIKASMTEEESLLSYFLPLLRYHSRWSDLDGDDFKYAFDKHQDITHQGYLMQTKIDPVDISDNRQPDDLLNVALPKRAIEYLDKMTALCKEKGVELILVKAPTNSIRYYWYPEWDAQMVDYAEKNGLVYYSLVGKDDEIGLDWSQDTYDKGLHLNVYGAEKFTSYFGKILAENHAIPDHRSDAELSAIWGARIDAYYKERNGEK